MVAQILNREFILDQLQQVQEILALDKDNRRALGPGPGLPFSPSPHDYDVLSEELAAGHTRESKKSSGQQGYDDVEARRGSESALLDDFVFLSHDPIISLLQTALQLYFDEHTDLVDTRPPADGRRGDDEVPLVTDACLVDAAPIPRGVGDNRRLFNAFSQTDPRWVASLMAKGVRLLRDKHAFNRNPAAPLTIHDHARLVLVGDWGTGLPRARAVAKQMRKEIEAGPRNHTHVIHLGDVYYSGWETEYKRNFLSHWPVHASDSPSIISWSLNGNHDMYSGGHAYYEVLLKDERFTHQQGSSFFSLHNANWDILGLDTAYEDEGLQEPQADWIAKAVLHSPRKTMLLSHHQLFSAYEHGCKLLQDRLATVLGQRTINVWFWGHEHRCVFYKPPAEYPRICNARLIGNGGVPVYMTHANNAPYKSPAYFEYRKFITSGFEKWSYFGFAVVDLFGPNARVRYIDEFGTTFAEEVLT